MNELQNLGWRRLLLTKEEKFRVDLKTLGKEKDKVQKTIIIFENLTKPRYVFHLLKRYFRPYIYKTYWAITPKRLRVCRRGTAIQEFLPWFNKSHLYKDSTGRISRAYGGDPAYVYSWKKAHEMMTEYKKEEEQRRLQFKIDMSLRRIIGGK
ncbi:hypothetical protein COK00_11770 [Bacillus cereus]|uniref:hypothetical protein n=1 Tax=Bacillus cereus TaxID=1396 RepID=UPI000BF28BCF|nr:hypothetical protein [Bacillus cereus]PFP65274.1 hypothetical protein COK00_11770 [Bacillus cereus]